jgi:hypothetical protein
LTGRKKGLERMRRWRRMSLKRTIRASECVCVCVCVGGGVEITVCVG